jgi:hypothetical protein
MREAEVPGGGVLARAVGYPVGVFRQRVEPREQLAKRHLAPQRHAVIDHVQIVFLEVDHAAPGGILDVGVTDVSIPLERSSRTPLCRLPLRGLRGE